jgi:hypothetical protein
MIWTELAAGPSPKSTDELRERLDKVVPGEWDLTLDLLPPQSVRDGAALCAFKARLQILGVIREGVGMGADYKSAAVVAFGRAAALFGVGKHGADAREAKSETPERSPARDAAAAAAGITIAPSAEPELVRTQRADPPAPAEGEEAQCPKCGGRMWDNRLSKRNAKAPDYKCRDRSCDGVIWPPRDGKPAETRRPALAHGPQPAAPDDEPPPPDDDDLPF